MNRPSVLIGFFVALFAIGASFGARAQSGEVVWYNTGGADLAAEVIPLFNKRYPDINVLVVNAGTGELLTRMRAEQSNPRGDVFQGTNEAYETAEELFEPYVSTEDAHYDRKWVHPNHLYYCYTTALQNFIVNTNLLPNADQRPTSWLDLAKPEFKGKIIMANPAVSGSAYGQLAQMVQLYGWDYVARVIENTTFVTSSRLVYQNVAKGEVEIGISEESHAVRLSQEGFPVVGIYPSEGTAMRCSASGLIKNGPNPENARLFVDFLRSEEGQMAVFKARGRRTVRNGMPAPEGLPPTADVPILANYNEQLAAEKSAEWLAKFDELFSKSR